MIRVYPSFNGEHIGYKEATMAQHSTAKVGMLALLLALLVGVALPGAAFAATGPGPLVSDFRIDHIGTVDPETGHATVYGSITCSRPVVIFLTTVLRQPANNPKAENFGFADIACDGTTAWSALVLADNGSYHAGRARADALAEWYDPATGDYSRDETFRYLLLKRAQ